MTTTDPGRGTGQGRQDGQGGQAFPGARSVQDLPSGELPGAPAGEVARSHARHVAALVWRSVSPLVVSAVVGIGLWWLALAVFGIDSSIGKTPPAVWRYLFSGPDAASARSAVGRALATSLGHAAIGFAAGMAAAVVVALLFVLYRPAEQALMPIAMVLRSVPLVALTPLIGLVFGHGIAGVAVMGGIVVFFPALVNVVQGLRSVHRQTRDLVVAYGGSELTVMRTVGFPTALPALFAAARISVPGALIGALVTEWLLTADGIGGAIPNAIGGFDYGLVWACIVVLTAVSVLVYTVVGALETAVLARYAPDRLAR